MIIDKNFFIYQGWKYSFYFRNVYTFEKGNVWKEDGKGAFLEFDENLMKIKITSTDKGLNSDGPNISIKYNGFCRNENDYDTIVELLDLQLLKI